MRSTSSGSRTMFSPLSENITTMVKSSDTSVMGLIAGINRFSYHSRPRLEQHEARQHPGEERNAEVDEDALGDAPHRDSRQVHVAELDARRAAGAP